MGVLATTDWVEKRMGKEGVRIVEVDVDTKAYEEGHVPGAVGWNWQTQLCDTIRRDVIGKEALERLLGESGIENRTTVVLYGDNNNWFACWAYWQLKMYGHARLKIMDGGRKKWIAEGRPLTQDVPAPARATYVAKPPRKALRALLPQVRRAVEKGGVALVDVRSPDEFSGRILCPPGLPETCQRGGHIPGAVNIPWGQNCRDDGTFKPPDELEALYASKGVTSERPVITYCRIGERSSLTWFVLREILGRNNVANYDGSWTEWGNLVNAPVEK